MDSQIGTVFIHSQCAKLSNSRQAHCRVSMQRVIGSSASVLLLAGYPAAWVVQTGYESRQMLPENYTASTNSKAA